MAEADGSARAATTALRIEELRRRAAALPRELGAWLARVRSTDQLDLNIHASQLNALDVLMQVGLARQAALLGAPPGPVGLVRWANQLGGVIAQCQRHWDYFRDKLEMRFSPQFKEPLWLADVVAADCHRPVVGRAVTQGLLDRDELREPPLTYLDSAVSPATLRRGDRPGNGYDFVLGKAKLPIPLISLPWESIENIWELVVIAHEVGHDLEADLHLRNAMQERLRVARIAPARRATWRRWQGEILADILALQLVGPAFLDALIHLLLLNKDEVIEGYSDDPHPTPYLRVLLGIEHCRTLIKPLPPALDTHLENITARWIALYPTPPDDLAKWTADFPHVLRTIADTPLRGPKSPSWRELVPYTARHDGDIRKAARYLRTGTVPPPAMSPRHIVAAARIAVENSAAASTELAADLGHIHERAAAMIRTYAPPGLRAAGGVMSSRHRMFIENFFDEVQP